MNKFLGLLLYLSVTAIVVGQTLKPVATLATPGALRFAAVCEDGSGLMGVGGDHDVHMWPLPAGDLRAIDIKEERVTWGAAACTQKISAVGLENGIVLVFDAAGNERQRVDLKDRLIALTVSPDGALLAVSTVNSPLQVWDITKGNRLWTGITDFGNTSAIRFVPDGNMIIAADADTKIRAYDLRGKLLYSVDDELLEPFDLSVSADGKKFAVAGAEGAIELYDTATGKRLKKSENCGNTIWGVMMAPGGTRVLAVELDDGFSMEPRAIGYWDTAGERLKSLAIDPISVIGSGRAVGSMVLVRQETPGKIKVESVE